MSEGDDHDQHLRRFVRSLTHGPAGLERPMAERNALIAAARDMLGRLTHPADRLGETSDANDAFRPNQVVAGVFSIVGLINRGGLGELYRARHRELGTDHAIKVLKAGFNTDPIATALLRNEARLLTLVRHDAVVGGQALLRDGDGRLLIVMEFLRGPNLKRVLRRGPMTLPDIITLGGRLTGGLAAMHRQAIVHNDVSPANIVLCDEQPGGAMLVDLGVARLLADLRSPHDQIDFAGKYSWVSPEQLTPIAPVDARSDLYSLGLVLAAAAGEPLWMGDGELVARRQRARVPPLDSVPAPLRPVLSRLLQPSPAARPATAEAAGALLAELVPVRRGLFGRNAS